MWIESYERGRLSRLAIHSLASGFGVARSRQLLWTFSARLWEERKLLNKRAAFLNDATFAYCSNVLLSASDQVPDTTRPLDPIFEQ